MNEAKYNNKADIFAFGCIIYEIVTGQKLFWDELAILNYASNGSLGSTILWPSAGGQTTYQLRSLEILVASMLELDLLKRPNARDIRTHAAATQYAYIYQFDPVAGIPLQVWNPWFAINASVNLRPPAVAQRSSSLMSHQRNSLSCDLSPQLKLFILMTLLIIENF